VKCPACEAAGDFPTFTAREMMFGWRHRFEYATCPACGTLLLAHVPGNLADYYPGDYYSLAAPKGGMRPGGGLRRSMGRWLVESPSAIAAGLASRMARKNPFLRWARIGGAGMGSAILDVGCGSGGLLRRMRRWGFSNLAGVDPFTGVETNEPGLKIARGELAAVTGKFDLIMFHHVLEHLADPAAALRAARARLNAGGRILVRIPVAGSRAAREYGPDWFNLDAPRHLVIPSVRGLGAIADRAGLAVRQTEFDSDEKAFGFSECYRRDVPMKEATLTPEEKKRWRKLAKELNRSGEADLGVFVLEPRPVSVAD
jgi:SAM-dependent methyltransferase